jgi:hypothetical protein
MRFRDRDSAPANGHTLVNRASHASGITTSEAARTRQKETEMGTVVTRCPATGEIIPTGMKAEHETFACSPVFFADTYCPVCDRTHRWFARDAWVVDARHDEPRRQVAQRAA